MTLSAEALYRQLGRIVAEMPVLEPTGQVPEAVNAWLGRAKALVELGGFGADAIQFQVAAQSLEGPLRASNFQTIKTILYAALARAELRAPASVKGAFIPAGGVYDVFAAFAKAMGEARQDILIVDPYADDKAITDFAVLAPEGVLVRILADREYRKASLEPALRRWGAQHGVTRPLEVRLALAKSLHDRLMIIDRAKVWNFGQSLNMIATRAHTSLEEAATETAVMKRAAFEAIWMAADPL